MNETDYLNQISGQIGKVIAEQDPVMKIDDRNVFTVMTEFLSDFIPEIGRDLIDGNVDQYIAHLLENARVLDPSLLNDDPYIRKIRFNTIKSGRYLLTNDSYEKGEILQYDFPKIDHGVYLPRLGYFSKKTNFPTIYENGIPWMSVIPSEINTMKGPISHAHGRMLVLGLGLGYYQYCTALKKEVSQITVIEKSKDVIQLFEDSILPQFESSAAKKIKLIEADAAEYMKTVRDGDYDGVFADVWQGAADGHQWYERLHPYELQWKHTSFDYWIEEYIHD